VPLSMNEGIPLVESNPRSPVALQVQQLSAHFSNLIPTPSRSNPGPATSRAGWLSRHRKETK
jgi:hypothetical protein